MKIIKNISYILFDFYMIVDRMNIINIMLCLLNKSSRLIRNIHSCISGLPHIPKQVRTLSHLELWNFAVATVVLNGYKFGFGDTN